MVQPSPRKKKKGKKKKEKNKKSDDVTIKPSSDAGRKETKPHNSLHPSSLEKVPSSSGKTSSEKKGQENKQGSSDSPASIHIGNKKGLNSISHAPSNNNKTGNSGKKKKDNGTHSRTRPSGSKKKPSKKVPPPPKTKTTVKVQSSSSGKASGKVLDPSSGKKADKGTQHSSSKKKKSKKKKRLDTTIQATPPIGLLIQTEESSGLDSGSTIHSRKLIKRHRSLELKQDALAIRASARPLLRSGESKHLISFRKSEAISTSYISARLSMVQILSRGLCFLKLDIQSIRSPQTRIDTMNIRWRFSKSIRNFCSIAPIVKEVAPKQSVGARDEETRQSKYGLEVPVQASQMGVTVGPKFTADFNVDRKVERGMVITGFIQGDEEARWRIKENSSAMSGVPSHFCVGVAIQYSGVIAMELELHATRQMEFMGFSLPSQPLHSSMTLELDVDSLQHDFEPENPPETWKEWFPKINGDVEGYNLTHSQVALTS